MSKLWINLIGIAAVALTVAVTTDLAAQTPAPAEQQLGVMAPANLAKPRPKPPFDITGAWLHAGGDENGERYLPPSTGFKFKPAAQAHFDAATKARAEGKVYRND